jgi:hypothetical protein
MIDETASINETLCLKWNDFEGTVSQAFHQLRTAGEFFDVTLACEDQCVEAHRSILSTCSPIFHNILKLKPPSQPVIDISSRGRNNRAEISARKVGLGQCM